MSLTDKNGRVNPIRLISDEPVFEQGDLGLGMETWAKIVAGVATGTDGPFTVGVFARWGRGKTSVLNRACHYASFADNTHAFIVNAWEHERHADPLQPIIQDVLRGIDIRLTQAENQEQLRALNGLKKLLTILTVTTAALTLGVPTAALAAPAIAEGLGGAADALKKAAEGGKEMAGAIEAISSLTSAGAAGASQGTGIRAMLSGARAAYAPNEKVIVFVDDLDRCHPDKAVHILESIKHLLWVPGFVFVLALDNEILEKYLQNRYEEKFGIKDDPKIGQRYLEKLVQLTLYLPESQTNFEEYVQKLITPPREPERLPADLIGLLVASAEANPRQAKRRINDLIVDVAIFKAEQKAKNAEFKANDAEIAACLAVNRLFYDIFSLNRDLVKRVASSQELCYVVLKALNEVSNGGTNREGRDLSAIHNEPLPSHADSISMVTTLVGNDLTNLFAIGQPARFWFEYEDLRKATREFLVHQRGEELDVPLPQREIIEEAIRRTLDLPAGQPITDVERGNVTELRLGGSALDDTGLHLIAKLTNLTFLRLDLTQLSDVSALANLTNLNHLDLDDTHVSNILGLANLTNLTSLFLGGSNVSEVSALANLTNLTSLRLDRTQVFDVSPLANLTNLTELHLSITQISDVSPLTYLANLTELHLSDTEVSDLTPLANLANLTELYLSDTEISDLSPLANLTNLKELYLSNTEVSDLSPLANLSNLKELYLSNTEVSDLSPLANLTNLTHLYLGGTNVSDVLPLANLTKLIQLRLSKTQVSDVSPLSHLTELKIFR